MAPLVSMIAVADASAGLLQWEVRDSSYQEWCDTASPAFRLVDEGKQNELGLEFCSLVTVFYFISEVLKFALTWEAEPFSPVKKTAVRVRHRRFKSFFKRQVPEFEVPTVKEVQARLDGPCDDFDSWGLDLSFWTGRVQMLYFVANCIMLAVGILSYTYLQRPYPWDMLGSYKYWFSLSMHPQFSWVFMSFAGRAAILYRHYTVALWMLDHRTTQKVCAILALLALPRILLFLPYMLLLSVAYGVVVLMLIPFADFLDNMYGAFLAATLFLGLMFLGPMMVARRLATDTYMCTYSHYVLISTSSVTPIVERSILLYPIVLLLIVAVLVAMGGLMDRLPILNAKVLVELCERHGRGAAVGLLDTPGLKGVQDFVQALDEGDEEHCFQATNSLRRYGKLNEPIHGSGRLPLGAALKANASLSILCSLLDEGADAHAKDSRGSDAIGIASRMGNTAFLEELKRRGVEVSAAKRATAYMMFPRRLMPF